MPEIEPVAALGLQATVHGVRYPPEALGALPTAGIANGGWLANHRAPQVFARHRVTVHVPRRHYVQRLPGIPTNRVFEALACRPSTATGSGSTSPMRSIARPIDTFPIPRGPA